MKYLMFAYATILLMACGHDDEDPRSMNGHTYLVTRDSVDYITFKIDSAKAREYDPKDDPR